MAKRMRTTNKPSLKLKNELVNNVKVIKVDDEIIDDEDHFFSLINEKDNDVETLHLINVTFDQQFYDQLPILCKQINNLKVKNVGATTTINCDFVLQFRSLKYFSINQHLSPELMDRMCSNFAEELDEIGFMYRNRRAKIHFFDRDDYPGRGRDEDFNPVGLQIGRYTANFDDCDELFGFLKNVL